jgi:hypothetical protein
MSETIELQGRAWQVRELEQIRQWVEQNPTWSRYRLSRELCVGWNWVRPNGNRPAEPCGARGSPGSCTGRTNRLTAKSRVGRIHPLGLGGGLLVAKVSFQPLGVSCQMSLFGWLGSRRRISWR